VDTLRWASAPTAGQADFPRLAFKLRYSALMLAKSAELALGTSLPGANSFTLRVRPVAFLPTVRTAGCSVTAQGPLLAFTYILHLSGRLCKEAIRQGAEGPLIVAGPVQAAVAGPCACSDRARARDRSGRGADCRAEAVEVCRGGRQLGGNVVRLPTLTRLGKVGAIQRTLQPGSTPLREAATFWPALGLLAPLPPRADARSGRDAGSQTEDIRRGGKYPAGNVAQLPLRAMLYQVCDV